MEDLESQMFQYSALRGIAKHHNYDWMIPHPNQYGDR